MADASIPQVNATQLLNNIPFPNLIGGPMAAAIQAQGLAAKQTVDFIYQVGLDAQAGDQSTAKVRTVFFKYVKTTTGKDGTVTQSDATLTVPLLTIVPIPFIRIDTMTITFKANINADSTAKTTSTQSTDTEKSWDGAVKVLFWSVDTGLRGSYSDKSSSTASQSSKYSVQYTLDVYVHAVQDQMPAGMQKVLNILQDSITASDGTTQ